MNIKCIIPCGGLGTRMSPWTKYICKELLPVNAKPCICYVVEELLSCKDITEIIFVISGDKTLMIDILIKYFPNDNSKFNFLFDNSHAGLDNAVFLAKKFCLNADATVLCWPDCFNSENEIKNLIVNFKGNSLVGCVEVGDVRHYGNVIANNKSIITGIVQKPKTNNTGSKLVFWGRAILNNKFWKTYDGNLDEAFIGQHIYLMRSQPFDTGNIDSFAEANYSLNQKKIK